MEYLETLRARNQVRERVLDLLRNNGYLMTETSYFEDYDDFIKFSGRTPKEKTVKVINNLGNIEILRPDITFNIVKSIADKYDGTPMKLFYDSVVFENGENSILEKRQMGAEYIGNMSIEADLEMIHIAKDILKPLGETMIVIGHTKYLEGLLKGILDYDLKRMIKETIYNKQPQQLNELLLTVELDNEIKDKLRYLVSVKKFDTEELANGYMNTDMKIALSEMSYLQSQLKERVSFDLSLLSKFEYYDGIIFKGYYKGMNKPLIRGGRYDRLARMFNKEMPAVGFSLEFDDLRSISC